MLGIGKPHKKWQWGVCGKHPVARDYFKISRATPAFEAFEKWVQRGYADVSKDAGHDTAVRSWRFWAKGLKKELIAGLVKDSCDTLGRPFPLLVVGGGMLDGWERHWECLPVFFEKLWESLEYMTARRLDGLSDLENGVLSIQLPENDPQRFCVIKDTLSRILPASDPDRRMSQPSDGTFKKKMAVIPMVELGEQGYSSWAGAWSALSKSYAEEAPNAVFVGGTVKKHYVVFFRRPINTADFAFLWSL